MSKKDKYKKSEAREPWEQSIYDTKEDNGHSRIEKRQHRKGNTVFLTILVILLLLIIALPIGTYWWVARDKPSSNGTTPSSSIVVSSTEQSTTTAPPAESSVQSSEAPAESTAPSGEGEQTDTPTVDTVEPLYTEVFAGEGFKQVAERNGITVEQLMELNGLSADAIIHPGDSLRVQ
ncbi:LysM peptidoglycan-binding domain-containing protein [Enterococcus sp. BWB1-3]|uniref:SAG1386/EF1546 family surface-associated protein n=1 Tax=unclassified Enterococcus TaxID=2608891 RepID=UPI001921C443|nr:MULTISPECIES: SAG1386/EF1546 family surface-associated protein [unclassified Enterococcus]MBL1228604.1 LysM peptidoglycan-binding domain-containing protein [Enterococcus sp. BWB1-3]MCB5950610.1 LysM peptidoglycan-binding domain-containing protein [Enterococcus sp. BWT-B8]MCB5955689.1 LysM peptidoglycan-binding domain-containing protein [Enterococcus sp. CWB-B31]